MLYPFESSDGEHVDLEFAPDDAPAIGEVIHRDGRTYRRLASMPQLCGAKEGSTRWPRFESHQLPKWWKYHKGEFSKDGKPRFSSRREVDEANARANHADGSVEIRYGEL